MNKFDNSKGQIFYGMHFYPGVARYEPPNEEPFTVFINESVIRNMGPTFAGCPIFVEHVDEVEENINKLRSEADGWVIESFFNAADGKHWAKFVIVSDIGLEAIKKGFKLSNAYVPQCANIPGTWNGVDYQREVMSGEFEHLAIVRNPRYEESEIMTPEQFKNYNDRQTVELKRLANSKDKKGEKTMLKIFKRTKVENSKEVDFDGLVVELPVSKTEVSLTKMVAEYDKIMNMNGYANGDHMVKVGDKDEMSVNDLVKKHLEMSNELQGMKEMKNADTEEGGELGKGADDDMENDMENDSEEQQVSAGLREIGDRGGDKHIDNEEDPEDKKKKDKEDKTKNAKDKASRLKNANNRESDEEIINISLPQDQVARGKALYGSGN
jgi:hypothetical protein